MTLVTRFPPPPRSERWINVDYIPCTPHPGNRACRLARPPGDTRGHDTVTTAVAPAGYSVLPCAAMLLAIAIGPLAFPHWWESNRNKLVVAGVLGAPILAAYIVRDPHALVHMS